jgi:hypothetical protein
MSFTCLKCHETWSFEDYTCPCCGFNTIDFDSDNNDTLEYKTKWLDEHHFEYDVIRISTGKSVFDDPGNYLNKESKESNV